LVDEPDDYLEQLSKMLEFITYRKFSTFFTDLLVLAEPPKDFNPGITKELLNDLWDSFVLKPLIPQERDIMFKWLITTLERNKS